MIQHVYNDRAFWMGPRPWELDLRHRPACGGLLARGVTLVQTAPGCDYGPEANPLH